MEPDDDEFPRWPSGQQRRPLRDRTDFNRDQVRAGRALLGLSTQALANIVEAWPYEVPLSAAAVEAFESGAEIGELEHAAICHALYNEGFGVIALKEGRAGQGVRYALPSWERVKGTHRDRAWAARWEPRVREAARIAAWDVHMTAKHGRWWYLSEDGRLRSIYPPPGWEPPGEGERTDGQSDGDPGGGSHAP